ncbi:MAG: MarR family transcriptional regulator [Ruminococcus sp.]|nr:MarR family transcriptional regulator [Ruminococcus sp.]
MSNYVSKEIKRFNYLISEIDSVYHETSLKFGLSDSSMQILYTICNNGGSCLLSDICLLSGISKQTINSAIHKLEKEGIIYLEVFKGKMKSVHFTDKGRKLAEDTVVHVINIENDIFSSWSEEERILYLDLTQRYLLELKKQTQQL